MSGIELDRVMVRRRLNHLANATDRLAAYQGVSLQRLESDEDLDWTVLHGLQLAIQAVLDITSHLITTSGKPVPEKYRSGILELANLGILPTEFAERIAAMAGFRNILIHEYLDVDLRLVKLLLDEQLNDFRVFGQLVEEHLERSNPD